MRVAPALFAMLLLAGAATAEQPRRYDRHGRALPPAEAAAPLFAGPPGAGAWRVHRSFGTQLPIYVDQRMLFDGLPESVRLRLPRVGPPGTDVDLYVDHVRADVPPPLRVPGLPSVAARTVVYTGTLRTDPTSVVVLSVVGGVLYGRVVVDDHAWVLQSDRLGTAIVRLEPRRPGLDRLGPEGVPTTPVRPFPQ